MKERLKKNILFMHEDPEGKRILDELMIDNFAPPQSEWYVSVKAMINRITAEGEDKSGVSQEP
jgi:hypothetical protein